MTKLLFMSSFPFQYENPSKNLARNIGNKRDGPANGIQQRQWEKKVAKNVGHFLANKKPLTSMNRQNLEKCGQHNSANVGQMDKAAVQWVVLEYKNILNISTTCSEESKVHNG